MGRDKTFLVYGWMMNLVQCAEDMVQALAAKGFLGILSCWTLMYDDVFVERVAELIRTMCMLSFQVDS